MQPVVKISSKWQHELKFKLVVSGFPHTTQHPATLEPPTIEVHTKPVLDGIIFIFVVDFKQMTAKIFTSIFRIPPCKAILTNGIKPGCNIHPRHLTFFNTDKIVRYTSKLVLRDTLVEETQV